MMSNSALFFIDILNVLPSKIDCYIQAPDLEDKIILNMMNDTEYPYYKVIHLDSKNKDEFIQYLKNTMIIDFFQSVEIREFSTLLFECYDGAEIGILSNKVLVPNWFNDKYIKGGVCIISPDW